MKRWLTHFGIAAYILALSVGFVSHAVDYGTNCHAIMYFLVWDMFCGWAGYEGRMEIVGEGESGKFYQLAPGPWGEFHPYGFIARQHYDPNQTSGWIIAKNVLDHTKHEPMVRIFVVEGEYPKKYNLPDAQYVAYYGKPKDFHSYYRTRYIMSPEGEVMTGQSTWFTYQYQVGVRDNPRLATDMTRRQPFMPSGPQIHTHGAYVPGGGHFYEPSDALMINSPLAQ